VALALHVFQHPRTRISRYLPFKDACRRELSADHFIRSPAEPASFLWCSRPDTNAHKLGTSRTVVDEINPHTLAITCKERRNVEQHNDSNISAVDNIHTDLNISLHYGCHSQAAGVSGQSLAVLHRGAKGRVVTGKQCHNPSLSHWQVDLNAS
jgi:hypothetical protein